MKYNNIDKWNDENIPCLNDTTKSIEEQGIQDIIKTATKTNKEVNKSLGLE